MNMMDQARNDAIKSGISPYYLPPPVQDIIFRMFGAFILFNFVSYIVIRTITHILKKEEEETLPLNQPTTLKRLMTLKEESDEDESPYANPPSLKRTRFEKEEDENIGKPYDSWAPLLHVTLQLEEKERSMNTPAPQYRIRIPLLPPSPPSSDSE